jgi:hypothetical protein
MLNPVVPEGVGMSAKLGALWALAVTAGLFVYVVATGITVGAVILVLPTSSGAIGLFAPRSIPALVVADVTLAWTTVLLLLGGEGLLYLPSFVAFLVATARATRAVQ